MASNPPNSARQLADLPLPDRGGPRFGRRRFFQASGGIVVAGAMASLLNACASSRSVDPAAAPTTSSATVPPDPSVTTTAREIGDGTLPVPPLLAPELDGATKVFRITAQKGEAKFVAAGPTSTLGFNGNYLGPTLRADLGEDVRVEVTNRLGETTTVHWHGLHVPAAMDGGPHQTIDDSTTWRPEFTIRQPAATLWYHPHMIGETQRQVSAGLVGLFIVDDANPVLDELPRTYGVDDIPLILQAPIFGADGQFVAGGGGGRGGDDGTMTTLVNGSIEPTLTTSASRLRFRILNASVEQFYDIGFTGDVAFHQIASDGGLLPTPVSMTHLQLAPAERAEIVVDVNPSAPMVLTSFGGGGPGIDDDQVVPGTLLTINPSQVPAPTGPLPSTLATIDRLAPESAEQTRDFVLAGNGQNPTINGQAMRGMSDMMDMTDTVQVALGSTEIWNVINRSDDTHAFHVHDVSFQILQRGDAPPAENESGLKDTVLVHPRETVRLIMRFTDFADPATPYMYHCHLLNHEDSGMMGQFLVV